MSESNRAIVIGAALGASPRLRLQSMGSETTVVEALDKPGGRATCAKWTATPSTWDPP